MTKAIIGLGLILAGIVLGLYLGLWWSLIGGIVAVINQLKADHVQALPLALGIVRIVFAGAIGWLSAFVLIIPGCVTLSTIK